MASAESSPRVGAVIEVLSKRKLIVHHPAPLESLREIAYRYDIPESRLREQNELADDFDLRKARRKPKLKVWAKRISPPREKVDHVVVEGDTWGEIARGYGVDYWELRSYNQSRIGRELEPGEVVHVWADPIVRAEIERGPGPEGLRRGAYSIGSPNDGELVNAVSMPESEDYALGYADGTWGTTSTVNATIKAIRAWREATDYHGALRLGAMSRRRGGELGQHKSHQAGRDLDVRLPMREEIPQGLSPEARRVDWLVTFHLLEAFASRPEVTAIFLEYKMQRRVHRAALEAGIPVERVEALLQYPVGSKASRGIVRHEDGHVRHIHVRFACGDYETECSDW